MASEPKLVVQLEARVRDFERQMQKANKAANDNFGAIERRGQKFTRKFEADIGGSMRRVNGLFKSFGAGLLGGIAAGFSADKMKQFLDTATGITNALKTAGLAGEELDRVYRKLYESAQRNAAPIESMAELYARVASAQKELGVSTDQVLELTDNVAKSLRISGKSAQEASGALLQLGQAMAGGKVQAEEYNSLLDGARPLLQAAATGMEQAGGSVAKLTALVKDGQVSSKAFFDAINAGSSVLDQQLGDATMTVSQGFQQVSNALVDAAKKFDETTETSKMLGSALGDVATAISNFNVDNAVAELSRFITTANDALFASQNFARSLGEMLGIDGLGKALTNSQLGIMLGSGGINQDRISGAPAAPPAYLQDWARRNYGSQMSTPKTGRLPAAPKVTPIDITRPEYAVKAAEGAAKETERAAKAAQRLAEQATDRLNASIASQTAVAVDAAATLLGKHEKKNSGDINSFLKRGGVDLNAATTAWCAAFVNSALAQVGVSGSGSNVATDFLNWGVKVNPSQIQRGDVLVDPNGNSAGQTGGHVGFATGQMRATAEGISQIEMLSGNASNQVQTDWVNASDVVARRATDAFQVPADALNHLTQESAAAKASADELAKSYEAWGQVAQTAVNGLATALADGKLEGKELLQILMQVVQQMLSMPSMGGGGGGGIGGFLANLLGGIPGFAKGTNFAPGGVAMVGEKGPELVNLPRGSQVMPNFQMGKLRGGGNETITINLQADPTVIAQVADQRIQTAAGTIVKISVKESQKATKANFSGYLADTQARRL